MCCIRYPPLRFLFIVSSAILFLFFWHQIFSHRSPKTKYCNPYVGIARKREEFKNELEIAESNYPIVPKKNYSILILAILSDNTSTYNFNKAIETQRCYAKIHNYSFLIVNDADYKEYCNQKDKFFRRHCISSIVVQSADYLLYIDADIGIVNPLRKIEEFIDPRYDVILYDRFYNQEVAAGSYLVKNTDYAVEFLLGFADYEKKQNPHAAHGTDNGGLHGFLLEHLFGNRSSEYRICMNVYEASRSVDHLFAFEACARATLGRWEHFGKIRILRKGTGWVRDSWITNSLWSPRRDFMLHGWKETQFIQYSDCDLPISIQKKIDHFLYYPLIGRLDLGLCNVGNYSWRRDANLVATREDIDAELIRMEFYIERQRYQRLALIPQILGF